MGCFVWSSWPPNSQYAPIEISFAVVALSFMVAGMAAWQRWPASRLGLLFTIVGYLYLVPYILVNLANPVAWTIGNPAEGIYGVALAQLGLAWPSGRLRSRFECGVIVADYVQNIAFNTASTMFWNPAFSGCDARCPANLLLVRSSRPAWNAINTIEGFVGLVITGVVLTWNRVPRRAGSGTRWPGHWVTRRCSWRSGGRVGPTIWTPRARPSTRTGRITAGPWYR